MSDDITQMQWEAMVRIERRLNNNGDKPILWAAERIAQLEAENKHAESNYQAALQESSDLRSTMNEKRTHEFAVLEAENERLRGLLNTNEG
jgi:hypothetical protein